MDLDLLAALADARPDWSIVMVGPVVKISNDDLPQRANLHFLGGKSYASCLIICADGSLLRDARLRIRPRRAQLARK